jgi:hypothetical protein
MRFFAFKSDLDYPVVIPKTDGGLVLDSSTSVRQQKTHFFECVHSLGDLIFLDKRLSHSELAAILQQPDAIFAQFHRTEDSPSWDTVPKRTLAHSLGDLLLPDLLYRHVTMHRANTVYLVTTAHQKARVEKHLGAAAPSMAVFTPNINENLFYPPSHKAKRAARAALGLSEQDIHIVYAGRWLATKGICQVLLALRLWPMANTKITVVGSFDRAFPIRFASASHYNFPEFFQREFITISKEKKVRMCPALAGESLRNMLWSADLFVYPSVHEDENFGMAPREAVLCGVPVVVSDFCGLHPLMTLMPWGGVATYPTINGPRYSVWQLRRKITEAIRASDWNPDACAAAVRRECNPDVSRSNLEEAAKSLLNEPLVTTLALRETEKKGRNELFRYANGSLVRAFIEKQDEVPDGALVDGTGACDPSFPAQQLQQAIHGFYTTIDKAPVVEVGSRLRGFFRMGMWQEERAIVEFGFPGPRMKRYDRRSWGLLVSCITTGWKTGMMMMTPRNRAQVTIAQELVDLGYLVPDEI